MASKGDIEFTGESGTVYVLNFGTNAACRLEEALAPRSFVEIEAEVLGDTPSVKTVREFMRAGLTQPVGSELTLEQVGDIVDDLGGWLPILAGLGSQSASAVRFRRDLLEAKKILDALETVKPTEPPAESPTPEAEVTH